MISSRSIPPSQDFCIGLDASRSIARHPTGTELYSRYLIDALIDRASANYTFRLYFNRAQQTAFSIQHSAISNRKSEILDFHVSGLTSVFRLKCYYTSPICCLSRLTCCR